MTLNAGYLMRRDPDLKGRIETAARQNPGSPRNNQWVDNNLAEVIATPGWAEKWTTAFMNELSDGVTSPKLGERRSVIADSDIEEAVAALIAAEDKEAADEQQQAATDAQRIADLEAKVDALIAASQGAPAETTA